MKKKETKEDMQAAENFFKEVSADVKSDNMKKLWDTYGLQIIIAVVIILTIAVSFETLKAWKLKHNESRSDAYSVALALQNQGRYDESLQVLGSYRMLVYGAFILVVLLFLPRGISGIIDIIRELLHRRKGGNHADAA